LLIAVINYVNLVTARLVKRTKEVEIRKILGGSKIGLFLHMMQETMLMIFIALAVATLLIHWILPFYNELTGKQLLFDFSAPEIWTTYLGLFLVVSLSAGIYPALKLISFRSTGLGSFYQAMQSKFVLRKVLIIIQFVFSLIFIVMAITMNMQLRFMKEKDPGYERKNIFSLPLRNMVDHYNAVKQELSQNNDIADITATNHPINSMYRGAMKTWTDENGEEKVFRAGVFWGDYNILAFFNIPVSEGKGFSQDDNPLSRLVLNTKAYEQLGDEYPIGTSFNFFAHDMMIVGKINDFHFHSLREEIGALAVMYNPVEVNYLYIKTLSGKTQQAIMTVEKIWKRYNDGYPFEYRFIDGDFDNLYKSDIQKEKLFSVFALIAILVSCLGLFGLVTYAAETKTKEIGIRKTYGAGVRNIVEMLSREFLILTGIAMPIAFPIAYYWLNRVLQDYAYRINISWWIFVLAASVTIVLTLLTVGVQALRAAAANPVRAIQSV
jgi:putative ABC transport system permease protein